MNKLVSPSGKKVRIYGAHTNDLISNIDINGYLPKGLYVSPNRNHAEGYLDLEGKRTLFTGLINVNDVNQESSVDWKTIVQTKIDHFRTW